MRLPPGTAHALFSNPVAFVAALPLIIKAFCAPEPMPDFKAIRGLNHMGQDTVLEYTDVSVLPPRAFAADGFVSNVFAVPEKDAVGTNDVDNGVSVLRFKGDDIHRDLVKKDFLTEVTGAFDFRFTRLWSKEEVAYTQTRGFVIVNVKKKNAEAYTICPGVDDYIQNVVPLDGKEREFVFEVLKPHWEDWEKVLRVAKFANDTFEVVAEHPAGIKTSSYSEPWFVHDGLIFIYNDSLTRIDVYDKKFQPTRHPLAEAFNANSRAFRCLLEIAVHPTLPIAAVVEIGKDPDLSKFASLPPAEKLAAVEPLYKEAGRRTLFLFRWTQSDPKQRFIPLLSKTNSVWHSYNPVDDYDGLDFSPDGKWLVFRDHTGKSSNPCFVAVPVDDKDPLYLGKPIRLGNAMREGAAGPKGTAWASDPTAFVMADGAAIYKWDLGLVQSMPHVKMPAGAKVPY